MKSAEELANEYYYVAETHPAKVERLVKFIKDIQSDAFHAGKLEGIKEAQEVVWKHANVFNVEVVKEIDLMDKQ